MSKDGTTGEKLPTSSSSCSSLPQGIQNLEITHSDDPTPTNSLHQVAPATSQPRKRSRINTNGEAALTPDDELPDILPYINKRARPSLGELGRGAYVKLRNIQTKYVRWETTLSFLKKYHELKTTPAYLRLTPVLPFSRDNVALQNRWSAILTDTQRRLLALLTDEADRQRANHKKQILDLRTQLRSNVANDKEYEEATAALQAVSDRTKKQEQAIKMKRLQRDLDAGNQKSAQDFPKPDRRNPGPDKTTTNKSKKNPKTRQARPKGKPGKISRADAELLALIRKLRK